MSKSSKQTTESKPPAWATPLLKKGAAEAMNLYDSGEGYTPYTGETRAGFSDPTLSGMNSALAATGYKGAPVTNDTWKQNSAVQNAKDMIQQLLAKRAEQEQAQTTSTGYTPTEREARLLAMGANPQQVLGDNYEAWANAPMTNSDYYARNRNNNNNQRERGGGSSR